MSLLDGTEWDGVPRPGLARLARILLCLDVKRAKLPLNAMMRGYMELGVLPPLPRLYYRPTDTSLARSYHFPSKDPGWESTSVTRPFLLTAAKMIVNQAYTVDYTMIPDYNTLHELNQFVNHKRSQRNDRVMTVGMLGMMTKQNPFREPAPVEQQLERGLIIPMGIENMDLVPPMFRHLQIERRLYG